MSKNFKDHPIINSPYEVPNYHYKLDTYGEPSLDCPPVSSRRESKYSAPVPKARKKKSQDNQSVMPMHPADGISTEDQEYNPTPIINEIRRHVAGWRVKKESDWEVTPPTARLLNHWREYEFIGIRPFFCQIEAVETIIWLTEVAPKHAKYKPILDHIKNANESANPDLTRLAMKMATGAGKTTVMAMLIAWHVANAEATPNSNKYSDGFLIVTPGITIRDRLRVLLPRDPDNYYEKNELVPREMLQTMKKAKIFITNYHAFQRQDVMKLNKTSRAFMQGHGAPLKTEETDKEMAQRMAKNLRGSNMKNICVINDEAHHCYEEKQGNNQIKTLKGDEKKDAETENKAARVWINGLKAFQKRFGLGAIYDLSATPFFLNGSGWREGTLFPWVVSDFSLIDAIECGIVKLPRVPIADNTISGEESPVFRNLWDHIGKDMPKKGRQNLNPQDIPETLQNALDQLYALYKKTDDVWRKSGVDTPPVFIVVCNNTTTSKLIFDYIAGWTRTDENGVEHVEHGRFDLFNNFDENNRLLPQSNTFLIDSREIESRTIDEKFLAIAKPQIEQFKRDRNQRMGAGNKDKVSDSELLREVMNTVGKKGKLGGKIRCVVSVSMLTEGWDTNTVTHILGVRAFGTQLLCEQVVGRGLRRRNYELNEKGMFDVEYADILGIPFAFTASPQIATVNPPKNMYRVEAMKDRADAEIIFPRVTGYHVDLPRERLQATFTEGSIYPISPETIGPTETLLQGLVGESITLTAQDLENRRHSTIVFQLAKRLIEKHFRDKEGYPEWHLFWDAKRICNQWLSEGYLQCEGETFPWMLGYPKIGGNATEHIYKAIVRKMDKGGDAQVLLDSYNKTGTTRHVNFVTSKEPWATNEKSHINYVISDSNWELKFASAVQDHPQVISYVKNHSLGFEVPYQYDKKSHKYIPDFIVKIDDGRGAHDPLYLVVEIKGFPDASEKIKSETMLTQWIPGVNNAGSYGRWAFAIFKNNPHDIKKELNALITKAIKDNQTTNKES